MKRFPSIAMFLAFALPSMLIGAEREAKAVAGRAAS
jgi:hypothetical protein